MCTSEKCKYLITKEINSKLKIKDIISYFDEGGNVVLVGDVDSSVSFRKLFHSLGVSLD